jgi:hypothetical protein
LWLPGLEAPAVPENESETKIEDMVESRRKNIEGQFTDFHLFNIEAAIPKVLPCGVPENPTILDNRCCQLYGNAVFGGLDARKTRNSPMFDRN